MPIPVEDSLQLESKLLESDLTNEILAAAIEVHRVLGPGLLESVYEQCMCRELKLRNVAYECQVPLPLIYKGDKVEAGFRIDLLVANRVVVEIKAVEKLLPVHDAQLLTYLKLTKKRVGLLINFSVPLLKEGIRRKVL